MEYKKIDKEIIKGLNQALKDNSCRDFFETLGFTVWDDNGQSDTYELSGIHTKGGVEMTFDINKDNWKDSFHEYYDTFDVDEEVRLYHEDPNSDYSQKFTFRQSCDDFEDWDKYIEIIDDIIESDGFYNYKRLHSHRNKPVNRVLLFPRSMFSLEQLDIDDFDLWQLYISNGYIRRYRPDDFADTVNKSNNINITEYYVKFISISE